MGHPVRKSDLCGFTYSALAGQFTAALKRYAFRTELASLERVDPLRRIEAEPGEVTAPAPSIESRDPLAAINWGRFRGRFAGWKVRQAALREIVCKASFAMIATIAAGGTPARPDGQPACPQSRHPRPLPIIHFHMT